jgi:hypothetical protein
MSPQNSTKKTVLGKAGVSDNFEPDDLQLLINCLSSKRFNGKAGNKSLKDALGWSDENERYWKAHGRALDQGLAISGRGKGGSLQLLVSDDDLSRDAAEATVEGKSEGKEIDLYDPAKNVIKEFWAKSEHFDEYIVSVTAMRGRASTGGKWSRPDISILAVKAYPFLPDRIFDIVTFEVKPAGQTTVEGVFEALSHQQFASRAYVVFHVPELEGAASFNDKISDGSRILGTARKHGVGLILASDIADWETWEEVLVAERVIPDPEQANRFIATGFPKDVHDRIIKWHK